MEKRIPPGQTITDKLPVLQYNDIPEINESGWTLRLFGLVGKEVLIDWQTLIKLPKIETTSDFHCVTKWSKLDNKWEGTSFKYIYELAKPNPSAKYVMAHSLDGYTTNIPLDILLLDDVLLAYKYDGILLTKEHGKPLRLVIPNKYAWKSAKWLCGLEFMDEDRQGFWEQNGYHNNADPWKNERFKWQECPDQSN